MLCPDDFSTATTPTSSGTDLAGHLRGSSADNLSSSKRPVADTARDPSEASPRLRKQRRVEGTPEKQAKEIRQLLRTQWNSPSSVVLGEAPARQSMTQAQIDRFRDIGLALIVMVSNSFDVSARTFVLSVKIFDRFLKGIEVLPPLQPPIEVLPQQQQPPTCLAQQAQHILRNKCGQIAYEYAIPVACFVISCKFCETFAPRLTDTVGVIDSKCTVEALCGAENRVLEALKWDVNLLTGAARKLPRRVCCTAARLKGKRVLVAHAGVQTTRRAGRDAHALQLHDSSASCADQLKGRNWDEGGVLQHRGDEVCDS